MSSRLLRTTAPAAMVMIGLSAPALAQTASQMVQPSYSPPVMRPVGGGVTLPALTGLDAPAGAEKVSVTLSGLSVEHGLPELYETTATMSAGVKGRRVTGAALFAIARELEEAYANAGFLLVRVSLPPQTVRDGMPLKLVVIDGTVDSVDVSALPEPARSRIANMLAPLVGRTGLTRAELERRLLLAGDTPGVMLKSTLKAGAKPGSTTIVVDGRYDPVTASVTSANDLAANLGRVSVGLGTDINNTLGLGETGYLRLIGSPDFKDPVFSDDPRNRQIVAGFNLPLGTDGFWLNMEAVDSRTDPTSSLAYTIEDHYQRLSTRVGYSWIRSRDFNTSSLIAFDVDEETQTLDFSGHRAPFTQDDLRVFRLTQTGDAVLPWGGQFGASVTASFGLNALGARSGTAALPLSRDGARPNFQKLEISASHGQFFLEDQARLSLTGKAQTSFGDALAASEQFGLGGLDWLSAFDTGKIQGDAGAVLRGEAAFPLRPDLIGRYGGAVTPYLFGAAGLVKLERPTAVERSVTRAGAFGAGVRLGFSEAAKPHSAMMTLEYARGEASGAGTRNRFNLRFSSQL